MICDHQGPCTTFCTPGSAPQRFRIALTIRETYFLSAGPSETKFVARWRLRSASRARRKLMPEEPRSTPEEPPNPDFRSNFQGFASWRSVYDLLRSCKSVPGISNHFRVVIPNTLLKSCKTRSKIPYLHFSRT